MWQVDLILFRHGKYYYIFLIINLYIHTYIYIYKPNYNNNHTIDSQLGIAKIHHRD